MLKRTGWDNDEVIDILERCKIHIDDKDRSEEHLAFLEAHNEAIKKVKLASSG